MMGGVGHRAEWTFEQFVGTVVGQAPDGPITFGRGVELAGAAWAAGNAFLPFPGGLFRSKSRRGFFY